MLSVVWKAWRTNLSVNANGNRMVPNAYFNSDGGVNRDWNNWDGDWNASNCFMLLCNSLDFFRYDVAEVFSWRLFFQPPSILPESSRRMMREA